MDLEVLVLKCVLGSWLLFLLLIFLLLLFALSFGLLLSIFLVGALRGFELVGHHLLLDVLNALGGLHRCNSSFDTSLSSNSAHVKLRSI